MNAVINMKRGFTLVELLVVITIIGILASIGLSTFTSAQAKGRDAKRKAHLRQLADSFEAYYNDKKQYPADDGAGNLMACGAGAIEACIWGTSSMQNTTTETVYMVQLPSDPTSNRSYYYDSLENNTKFQLYARLENERDPNLITITNPECGTGIICNYGISSSNISPEEGRL